jgi:uncharacterized protein (TIGR02611 family)
MNRHAKRVLVLIIGWIFILFGVVGLFLPILQGVLFILIGLAILSTEYVWAHHLLGKLRQRLPKIAHAADHATAKVAAWMRYLSGQRPSD